MGRGGGPRTRDDGGGNGLDDEAEVGEAPEETQHPAEREWMGAGGTGARRHHWCRDWLGPAGPDDDPRLATPGKFRPARHGSARHQATVITFAVITLISVITCAVITFSVITYAVIACSVIACSVVPYSPSHH